jgi:small neutral amino acid transporter SnatA (MarC family)
MAPDFATCALPTRFVVVDPAGPTPTLLAVTEHLPRAAPDAVSRRAWDDALSLH